MDMRQIDNGHTAANEGNKDATVRNTEANERNKGATKPDNHIIMH